MKYVSFKIIYIYVCVCVWVCVYVCPDLLNKK